MKTVLITGGAGFIGFHLVKALLKKNYFVICIDNFDNFYNPQYKEQNITAVKNHKKFELYRTDIRKLNEIKIIFQKHSPFYSIVHLAARAGVRPSLKKPLLYQKINIQGTYNLLVLLSKFKTRQLVFASSSSVYGDTQTPFNEDKSLIKPLSFYGATKIAGEYACYAFHKNFQIPTTILRFFSVYGPCGRPDMAPYLFTESLFQNKIIKQFGDGSSARDWTYIDDIVEGIEKVIKNPFPFEIFNLGGSSPILLRDLLKTIEKYTHKKFKKIISPKRNDEPKITYSDISKARKMLNWEPKISFNEGMKRFITWFKKERLEIGQKNF